MSFPLIIDNSIVMYQLSKFLLHFTHHLSVGNEMALIYIHHLLYLLGLGIFDYLDRADGIFALWINYLMKLRLHVTSASVGIGFRNIYKTAVPYLIKRSHSSCASSSYSFKSNLISPGTPRDRVYITGERLRKPVVLDQHELLLPGDAEGWRYEVRWEQGARSLGRTCSYGKIYPRRGLFSNRLASLFMHPQILPAT